MASDERSREDDTRRRNRAGWSAGGATGAAAGLLGGLVVASLGVMAGVVAGAVLGGVMGRWIASRISVEEWEPANDHPFVGMRAPDADERRA